VPDRGPAERAVCEVVTPGDHIGPCYGAEFLRSVGDCGWKLVAVPPEIEWFANITNPSTRRAYENAIQDFMRFIGITLSGGQEAT
jgi:hypothetical protein